MSEKWTLASPTVRWRIVPDDVPYDASYIDTWDDLDADQKEEEKRLILAQSWREGVWGYEVEVLKNVKCKHCDEVTHQQWEHHDSCWSFIGYETAEEECKAVLKTLT